MNPPRLRALQGLSNADALKKLDELERRARQGSAISGKRAARFILRRLQDARAYYLAEQAKAQPVANQDWRAAMQPK